VVAHTYLWTLKLLGPTTFTTSSLCWERSPVSFSLVRYYDIVVRYYFYSQATPYNKWILVTRLVPRSCLHQPLNNSGECWNLFPLLRRLGIVNNPMNILIFSYIKKPVLLCSMWYVTGSEVSTSCMRHKSCSEVLFSILWCCSSGDHP
jgi:hypothetical protein